MPELLCKRCDVFVGYGALGVVKRPDEDEGWLRSHCWVCRRHRIEIERDQGGGAEPGSETRFLGAFAAHDGSEREGPQGPVTPPRTGYAAMRLADPHGRPGFMSSDRPFRPGPDPETPIDRYVTSYLGEPRGGVVKDVAFNRKQFGEGQPENPDQGHIYVGGDGLRVTLEQDFNDEELQHFFSYAINATRGIDPENPPEPVDWEEMMRGGLQTALKRINIAFAVYGASRTATHQIVRSTRANFHQQSQRAHYYGDRPSVRMPESWLGKSADSGTHPLRLLYEELVEHASWVYRKATDAGVSYQDARFALLEGTTNFILCEYSLDEFIAVYAYRGCSMFQWEIVTIMRMMRAALIERHPWLEPYIKISCEKTKGALDPQYYAATGATTEDVAHTCTFMGWESVEGQCDFPWAREANRSFRSERHAIVNKSEKP